MLQCVHTLWTLASSLRFQARDVAPCWIPKNSDMNRRLIDTECRQVCEGTGDAVLERDGRGGEGGTVAERERTAPQAKPLAGRGFGASAPNYSKQYLDKELML